MLDRYELKSFLSKSKDGGLVKYEDVEELISLLDFYKEICDEYIPDELKEEANNKIIDFDGRETMAKDMISIKGRFKG
jgi:predicted nucleotidyltransferase